MIVKEIKNSEIKYFLNLEKKKYRELNKQYLVFGRHLVIEGLKANKIKQILITEEELTKYSQYLESENIIVILMKKSHFQRFKSVTTTPNVVAICDISDNPKLDVKVNVVGINKIQDPGNLGTIIRTAKAFGVENIYLDYGTVDLFNSKVIQSMQGVHFKMNIFQGDLYKYCKNFDGNIITTFLDDSHNYDSFINIDNKVSNFLLILGNESKGIENKYKFLQHLNFKINIEYESLNVGVAGGIIMYRLLKEKNDGI